MPPVVDAGADAASPDVVADAAGPDLGPADRSGVADVADVADGPTAAGPDVNPPWYEPSAAPKAFVFTITADGGLWLRTSTLESLSVDRPPWTEAKDLKSLAGPIAVVNEVEAQSIGADVTLFARTGGQVQEARLRTSGWTSWTPVVDGVSAMGLANVQGTAWACLVNSSGSPMLGRRLPAGTWSEFEDVSAQALVPPGEGERPAVFNKIDCAGFGPDLEIVALDDRGRLWHATRKPTDWTRFYRVAKASDLTFIDIDAAASAGALHVLGSAQLTQYHATRSGDGVWEVFRDVEMAGGRDPESMVVAGSETSAFTEVMWFQVNSVGQLWLSVRYRFFPLAEFERIDVPAQSPIVGVAATVAIM